LEVAFKLFISETEQILMSLLQNSNKKIVYEWNRKGDSKHM